MNHGERCDNDSKQRRASNDSDDIGLFFLHPYVGSDRQGTSVEGQVEESKQERDERVVKDERFERGSFWGGGRER